MVLRCDPFSDWNMDRRCWHQKADIFFLIFSQKMGISILGGPLRKSILRHVRSVWLVHGSCTGRCVVYTDHLVSLIFASLLASLHQMHIILNKQNQSLETTDLLHIKRRITLSSGVAICNKFGLYIWPITTPCFACLHFLPKNPACVSKTGEILNVTDVHSRPGTRLVTIHKQRVKASLSSRCPSNKYDSNKAIVSSPLKGTV